MPREAKRRFPTSFASILALAFPIQVMVVIVLPSFGLQGCRGSKPPAWRPTAYIRVEAIAECSGIVASRTQDGVYWVHNDSGDEPRIFALDEDANLLCIVHVLGAKHVDWEDIATDDSGNLYIGDIGNNHDERRDLTVYVLPEPRILTDSTPTEIEIAVSRAIPFRYPEQVRFPDPDLLLFDCEAMFWNDGELYVLTKQHKEMRTTLYRIPQEGEGERKAERLGEYDVGSRVTAADMSSDGRYLVVLSYQYIHVFERSEVGDNFLGGNVDRILIEGRQCEALCIDGRYIRFANEQREMFSVPLADLLRAKRFLPEPPAMALPAVELALDGRDDEWSSFEPLALQHDIEDGLEPPSESAPRIRMGWTPTGFAMHGCFRAYSDSGAVGEAPLLGVMIGAAGPREPTLREADRVYEITFAPDRLVSHQRPAEASPARVLTTTHGDTLCVETMFPVANDAHLEIGGQWTLNVIARQPGRDHPSWAWAGSASTQPQENPLLWGTVELLFRPSVGP